MLRALIFFLLVAGLWAREPAQAVSENDPSSLVQGVSVITGDLYTFEEDYVVQGAEPIHICRSYLSRVGHFSDYRHLTAKFSCYTNWFLINEPNGTEIVYFPDPQNNIFPVIGDKFYGKHPKTLKYRALTNDDKGTANTKSGEISGKSNLKNQYLIFEPSKDKKGKSFTLHAANGTIRRYINFNDQEKEKGPYGEQYTEYAYKLVSETLPNGHMVHYHWDKKNRMDRIHTTDMSQKKTFASVKIPVNEGKDPAVKVTLIGSDQRSATYHAHPTVNRCPYVMCKLISPDLPDQQYGWDVKKTWTDHEIKLPYLSSYSLPKSRDLHVSYYDDYEHRVHTLKGRVGKDAALITTHTFTYDTRNKNSYVIDAKGNKTQYFWNDDYRLTRVDRYVGEKDLHSTDLFQWEGNLLKSKSFLDENGKPLFSRTYDYDAWGNVKTNTFSGNLTGSENWESYSQRKTYSEDGKNLLLREEGSNDLAITYSYWKNTHLPYVKTVYEGKKAQIFTTYEYDEDYILISETVDDGVSKKIKKITPRKEEPYIGLPEMIEEYGGTVLLRKTVLHYGAGAAIVQKDIYDANNKLRYILKMGYDDKGRLISETNALGQEAIYKYDDVGNRIYEKDFSGRLEISCDYDYSNRLIKKEEKGSDGVTRKSTYSYDVKHNLISETDPYGNETTYLPNPFGSRKEIHLPPIENEKGELVYPIIFQTFDSAGNVISRTDAEKNVTKTKYTAYNQPYLITHPDNATEKFTYYLDGKLATHTDSIGVVTSYTYDYLGRVKTKTIANATEVYEYEGSVLKRKIDAEKNETVYEYDFAGRKKSQTCCGETTIYHYDELGRVEKTEKGDLAIRTQYDLLDRVIGETNETLSGEVLRKVRYEYDDVNGCKTIIRKIQGSEAREKFKYDSVGRLVERKDALGFVETWKYDPKIHQTTHTDALNLKTIEIFNAFNEPSSLEKRAKGKTLFHEKKFYNQNGQPCLQINTVYDPDGSCRDVKTRWDYDCRGQIKTLIEADGSLDAKMTHYTYTPRNELKTLTKPSGVVLTYQNNDFGWLESLVSSDGSVNHIMKYNLLGHLNEHDGLIRTTDPFGRIINDTLLQGIAIENAYDEQGRRKTCKMPKADCLITYEYDPVHLKTVTRKKLDETALYAHTYLEHDFAGNVLSEKRIDGETSRFTFDLLNRKTSVYSFPFGEEITKFDPVGNIVKIRKGGIGYLDYTYDDLYQLTSEKGQFDHTYAFDSLNNRLQKDGENYKINALNQVASHFNYDLNGNPIQHSGTTYAYDALDRLIRIETSDFAQVFHYDSLHRCLSKTTIQNSAQKTQYFLYDGQNEIGAFDEEGRPIELRILGDTPHAEIGAAIAIELNGKPCVPIHDLHGSISVLKPLDSIPSFYHYNAFGEEKVCGETISPWRFSSKRTDSQTKLVYFGRRYYMPAFGRWLNPDPAGYVDGMNLYAYVHNNPLTHFDEYGLLDYGQYSPGWKDSNPISEFGKFLGAQVMHHVYDNTYASAMRDLHRSYNTLYPNTYSVQYTEDRILRDKQWIDGLFGIEPNSPLAFQNYKPYEGFTIAEIPFGPGLPLARSPRASKPLVNRSTLTPSKPLQVPREYIEPHQIRFSQPTVSQNYSSGGEINDLIKGLRQGTIMPEDVPIIRVVEYEGKLYTLDNRRLVAFQNAGIEKIPVQRLSLKDPKIRKEFDRKWNPVNEGKKIVVIPNADARESASELLREYGKIK